MTHVILQSSVKVLLIDGCLLMDVCGFFSSHKFVSLGTLLSTNDN